MCLARERPIVKEKKTPSLFILLLLRFQKTNEKQKSRNFFRALECFSVCLCFFCFVEVFDELLRYPWEITAFFCSYFSWSLDVLESYPWEISVMTDPFMKISNDLVTATQWAPLSLVHTLSLEPSGNTYSQPHLAYTFFPSSNIDKTHWYKIVELFQWCHYA